MENNYKRKWGDHQGQGSGNKRFKKIKSTSKKPEEFDLLSKSFLKVVFDSTPRPHFIIVPRDGVKLDGINYSQSSKLELVRAATTLISGYQQLERDSAILSIHRGHWSDQEEFHAHVCVEVEGYIQVFKQKEKDSPDKDYIKKKWKKNSKKYEKGVRSYPLKSYFKGEVKSIKEMFNKDELKSIEEMIKKKKTEKSNKEMIEKEQEKKIEEMSKEKEQEPTTEEISEVKGKVNQNPTTSENYHGYTLLYHASEPKVGFALEKKSKDKKYLDYVKTFDAMHNFAKEMEMTKRPKKKEKKNSDKGCHLCLVLGEDQHYGKFLRENSFPISIRVKVLVQFNTSVIKTRVSYLINVLVD